MGNQALNNDLRQVQERTFDEKKLDQYLKKLWTFEDLESMRYKTISSAIVNVSDPALAKQFPTQCTVEPFTDRNVGKATPAHFVKENTVMAGFTSGEKKIDILRQQDVKLLRVENNPKSVEFESAMHGKIGILTAALLTRHKGGDTIEDWLTYASKEETVMGDTHQMSSAFNVALLCNVDSLNFLLASQPAFLAAVLEQLLEQARATGMGSLCEKGSLKSLSSDVKLKQMRKLLTAIARSSSADAAMKTLAVRLLLRLGYVFASAEDMLLAADLQAELQLDVTWELMPLLDKSEKMRAYVPPAKPDAGGEKWCMTDENTIQSRVSFSGTDDRTQDADAGTCDDKYYYMFSHNRGLFKGLARDSDLYWEESSGCTEVASTYKNLTFVRIDGQVHLRSSHLADEPFVLLDRDTCKVKEGYEPWTSEGNLLNWSKTDEQSTEGDSDKGFRYLRATQMHYHDDELWIVAPYYEGAYESSIKRLVVEVYSKEGRHFTRTQEIPLTKEDGVTAFQGAKRRKHDYLDRGMLHKNASYIILHSGKTIHVFDRSSGRRVHKGHWNGTTHVIFFQPRNQTFTWMDCACYSYLKFMKVKGYDPLNQAVAEAEQEVELPICLDETKQAIKKELMAQNEEETKEEAKVSEEAKEGEEPKEAEKKQKQRSKPKANCVRYLMGLDDKETRDQSTEAVPAITSQVANIHAQSKAIIYSFVNVEANYAMKGAFYSQDSPPFGADMFPFFKAPYSVYLNRDFVMLIDKNLKAAIQAASGESPDIHDQISLLTMLHLLSATLASVKCCRMRLQQILNAEELATLGETTPLLSLVKAPQSSAGKQPEDLTKVEAMAINCANVAKPLFRALSATLDTITAGDKLSSIQSGLNSSSPESVHSLMVALASKEEMTKLFADPRGLKDLLPALNGCCFTVNQSLKRVLQRAIREKQFSNDLDNEFCQAASSLQSIICQELCAAYGSHLYNINECRDKARGPKPDSVTDEEFSKCQNTYNGAVEGVKGLDKLLYQAFINIAEHIKFQMNQLSQMVEGVDTATWTEQDLEDMLKCFKALFSRDASILRSSMLFSLFFASFEVDVTWLDEIAEGLKNVLAAVNATLLNIKGIRLDSSPLHSLEDNGFVVYLQNVLRQISYTTGWVAGRLIQHRQAEDETLSKLNILQGGIENRFIPGLSEATKVQIEGSFKIAGDKTLQKLALSQAQSIVLDSDDTLLRDIISNGDSVKLTLEVLQQALQTKQPMCVFARLGGQAGADISRAAFAAMVKFSSTEMDFEGFNNQVESFATQVTSEGVQRLKDIIAKLKESSSALYDALLKRWESANQMRKWTQQIKLNISERTYAEAEEAFRKEVNDANPSAEPLTGSLSDEQKRIVEERSNTKFDEDLKTTYAGVVQKAQLLIKLQVPSVYKAQKAKNPTLGLERHTSVAAQDKHEEKANLHIMIKQQTEEKDGEYDWTDRLKQWKKVQHAQGAIVDLSDKKQLNSQSASIAILGLLQSEFSCDKISQTLENSLINGLRRMAGLNLLNHAMGLQGSHQLFFDMLQWFTASLRQRQQTSAHFLDGLSGCGNSCESGIRSQFFKVIKKIILKLKISIDQDEIKLLLNVLCWNYKTTDHEDLIRSGVFEMLSKGNGSDLNWVSYNMGNYRWHMHATFDDSQPLLSLNLGRTLQQTCEYIQNQVLAGIIETDSEVASIESKQSQAKMTQAQSTLDEAASTTVFSQMSGLVFDNISRSLKINRMVPSAVRVARKGRFELDLFTKEDTFDVDGTRSTTIDCREKNPAIKTLVDLEKALKKNNKFEQLKFNMLVHKIVTEQRNEGVTEVLEAFLKQKVGPALGHRNLSQIIDCVKARDLVVQSLLLQTSFEELGMTQPEEPAEEESEEEIVVKKENRCRNGHLMEVASESYRRGNCDLCRGDRTAAGASGFLQCRPCDYDVCYNCKQEDEVVKVEKKMTEKELRELARCTETVWKDLVKETPSVGKTHGDTDCQYGDMDLLKTDSTQVPLVRAIEVNTDDSLVFGFQLEYANGYKTPHHMGGHAGDSCVVKRIELEAGEYLSGAGGRFGNVCDQLWFTTSHGRTLEFGGSGGTHETCDTSEAKRPLIVALGAGMGGHVHHAVCHYLDMAQLEELKLDLPPVEGEEEEEKKAEEPVEPTEEERLNGLCKEVRDAAKKLKTDSRIKGDKAARIWSDGSCGSNIDSVPQYRMVMQLEQLIGIAEKNSLVNSLLQESINSSNIQSLIELAAQAHPHVQQLVQRIFQILLRMEIPHEIFEGAIEACPKVDSRGVQTRVAKLIAKKGVLSFPESNFLTILCNLVQETFEKRSLRDNWMFAATWDATVETVRTLRVLQTHQSKNVALSALLKNQLKEALLAVESKSQAGVETLFFLMGETRPLHSWNVGQVVRAGDGEIYTILNTDDDQQLRDLLYVDTENPKRQEFVERSAEAQKSGALYPATMLPLHDMHAADTETAAKNSVFMDPEVIKKLLSLLKDGAGSSLLPLSARILETSISRGFMNMLTTLKLEYISLLNEHNVFNEMVGYFVQVAGESSAKFDEALRDAVQKDMHIVSRTQNWTDGVNSISEYHAPRLYANEKQTQAMFVIPTFDYSGKALRELRHYELVQLKHVVYADTIEGKVFEDDCRLVARDADLFSLYDNAWTREDCTDFGQQFIRSKKIQEMSFTTALMLFDSRIVWTDDEVPIEELLTGIRTALEQDKGINEVIVGDLKTYNPRIIVLAKADYDRVYLWCSNGQFSHEERATVGKCEDSRAIAMDDLCSRLRRTTFEAAHVGETLYEGEAWVAKKFLELEEGKTVAELMDVLLATWDNEDSEDVFGDKDLWKPVMEDVKNGVAFQMPPSQEKVEETQAKVAGAIGAMFKSKQPAAAIPNFTEMFTTCEEALEKAKDNFPHRDELRNNQEHGWEDYFCKEMKLGNNQERDRSTGEARKQGLEELQQLYDEYKTANQAICRNSLMITLESAGNSLNESSRALLNQEDMMTKLDDLIHNEHMMHAHQSICFGDKSQFQKSEEKITNTLKLFGQSPPIKQFLVEDFFKRGKETVQKLAKDDWEQYRSDYGEKGLMKGWRSVVQLEEILDPANVLLLSKQFIEQGFIEDAQLPESLIAFIDLCLVYSTFLQKDVTATINDDLLKHIIYLTDKISENLALFRGKTELITRLFTNKLFGALMGKVEVSDMKTKERYQIMMEVAMKTSKLKESVQVELGETIAIDLNFPEALERLFKAIDVLADGTGFSSHMNKIKYNTLLDAQDSQIAHLASSYRTADKRFTTAISKTFGPEEADWTLRVTKLNSASFLSAVTEEGQIMCDRASLASGGVSKIVCKAGQTLTIKFPVKPTLVKWTGCLKTRASDGAADHMRSLAGYSVMVETAAISPVQILGTSNHLTFVAADGSVYGMGSRVQSEHHSATEEAERFKKIKFPEGLSASDIQKVHVEKFARLIWTKDGRFFHNGQHKQYMWGPTKTSTSSEDTEGFVEMNKDWFRNGDDKIVDWVCGKHNNTVLTESGKMICSGYVFYRQFESSMRANDENYEDWPFKVPAPEHYSFAVKAFPSYKRHCVFVNWRNEAGKIRSFRIGMADNDQQSGTWRELDLPDGGHFKQISATRGFLFGICNLDKLWVWGVNSECDEALPRDEAAGPDCLATRDWNAPNLFKWFADRKLKALTVKTGWAMAVVLTEDAQGKKEFYGIGKNINEFSNSGGAEFPSRFGANAKAVHGACIYLITDVDANQVADYAVTYHSVAYLLKGDNKKQVSIVPDKPEAEGLTHFFKKEDDSWGFVTDDEYDEKKADLPALCFATRHPISNFGEKTFADLPALQSQLTLAAEGDPQYFTKFTLTGGEGEETTSVTATEDMARQGGQQYDMNPVIFVRTSKPCANALEILPSIKLTDFFSQTEDDEGVAFAIERTKLTSADLDPLEIHDDASKKFISDLKGFTPDQDAQLMHQLDLIARAKSVEATSVKPRTLNLDEFTWGKENVLAKMDEKVVKLRCKLLLSLVRSWQTIEKVSDLSSKDVPGSISNLLFAKKYLVPSSVLSVIVDKACNDVSSGGQPSVSVSRLRARAFADSGKIDVEGKYTIYGQLIQQLQADCSDMNNFRHQSTDEKAYSVTFKGEGGIDAGGLFRETLTNIAEELESGVVPILIRSPNNKNEHGTNRECFILDSRSTTPSHKVMLKYFGGFLAYAFLTKSPIPFNLAPWVWKQLLHEPVTLADLDGIDAYSAQVLRDMSQHAQNLSDEDFQYGVDQNFTTVLSCGDEVPLCPDGENVKVTKANIGEFIEKVLEARSKEAGSQVAVIREGFLKVIEQRTAILDFLDWETFEKRCTGDKKISVERLKTITTFPNNGADHEIIPRFWRVFEAFNDAERAAYLKFIWGRCRLPMDLTTLAYRHQVRLTESMSATAFPQAHTCFFQIDVPNYATDEMMSQRLRVAAELCGEMDTDNGATEDID